MVNKSMNEEKTLTINDLLQIQKIIDVAVQRGAFKAEETRIVGEAYEKITEFLNAVNDANGTNDTTNDYTNEPQEEDSQND